MDLSRRCILQSILPGAALLAVTRSASAAEAAPLLGRARRLLVLHLSGGVRSSAAFLASGKKALNPWGLVGGGALPIGRVLDDHIATEPAPPRDVYTLRTGHLGGMRVPPLRELTRAFSVLGTWDPSRGDHDRSLRIIASGSTSLDAPGLVVKLFAALSDMTKADLVPPFVLGNAQSFATARGDYARYAAVDLRDPTRLPSASKAARSVATATGNDFVPKATDAVPFAAGAGGRDLVDAFATHHRTSRKLGQLLSLPALDVMRGEGSLGEIRSDKSSAPLTNEMLREIMVIPTRIEGGIGENGQSSDGGAAAALAVRLLQIGSPAVAIDVPGFDAHSGERTAAPRVYRHVGATLATLHFVLSRLADPIEPKVSMLDRTLVVTTSEFGRDPGQTTTGFNGGEGTDHGSHPACYYLAHAVMGAGVPGGRIVGGVSTESYDARRESVRYSPQRFLATTLHALGIDVARNAYGFDNAAPIEELWKGA